MISQITPAGLRPGEPREVDGRLGLAGALEHAAGLAFSGKTWPGWTRSRGRALGSIATWIVRARSAAEMPVVTPSRASIETVNGVSNGDSFLRRHQVEAELVAALGRQRRGRSARARASP